MLPSTSKILYSLDTCMYCSFQGLLGQFDKLEVKIKEATENCKIWISGLKTDLDLQCKTSTKSIKSFLREKNLELNTAQHTTYHEVQTIRVELDRELAKLNTNIRDFISDGYRDVENLRTDCVAHAVKIVSDYK